MAHKLSEKTENESGAGRRSIDRGSSQLGRSPGHTTGTITLPMPHEWSTGGSEVKSTTLRTWLSTVPEHRYISGPHQSSGGPKIPWGLGMKCRNVSSPWSVSFHQLQSKCSFFFFLIGDVYPAPCPQSTSWLFWHTGCVPCEFVSSITTSHLWPTLCIVCRSNHKQK